MMTKQTVSEKNVKVSNDDSSSKGKKREEKGKRKQHSEQNTKWRAEVKIFVHVQLRKKMTTQKQRSDIHYSSKKKS